MKCDECKFWVVSNAKDSGECRLNPPQILLVPMPVEVLNLQPMLSVSGYFPRTRPELWCGRFIQKLSVVGKGIIGSAANVFPIKGGVD